MYLLRMPKADENMGEGTVARWLVSAGDEVAVDQDVVECIADKGEFMVYAEEAGTLRETYAAEQSVVPVGYILATVGPPDESLPDVASENAAIVARAREKLTTRPGLGSRPSERVRATPAARRLAKEKGVSLADVASRIGGRIVREEDVASFMEGTGAGNATEEGA